MEHQPSSHDLKEVLVAIEQGNEPDPERLAQITKFVALVVESRDLNAAYGSHLIVALEPRAAYGNSAQILRDEGAKFLKALKGGNLPLISDTLKRWRTGFAHEAA